MKSVTKPVRDGAAEGRTGDWGEVVTRYPYENVGMDHLLSMEFILIEKQLYENFRACTFYVKSSRELHFDSFYLVLRDSFLSDIVL